MRLVGMMACRNEAHVIGLSARVALLWCDSLVILNHASTDASSDILADLYREDPRLVVLHEPDPAWDEMRHRNTMLEAARALGATHLAICDADEVLSGNILEIKMDGDKINNRGIRGRIDTMPQGSILQLPGYNLRGSLNKYHLNGMWGHRWFSTAFRDDRFLHWDGDKFHAREPEGRILMGYKPIAQGHGGVMHLWGVSERRLRAKHRAYRIQERLRWPDKPAAEINRMYGWWEKGRPEVGDSPAHWTYAPVPESWWAPYSHLMKYLDVDAEPWQDRWVDEMIAQHGAAKFQGLDV